MTQSTDDELGALLTETFAAHEHLADPEQAVRLATQPGSPPSQRGRVLIGAAAAVALVAVGASYAVSQGGGSPAPGAAGPSTPGVLGGNPPLPPLQTDAGNEAAAVRAADQLATGLPVFPDAQETDAADVPALGDDTLSTVHPQGHTIERSRFWTVSGVTSNEVVHWYAGHPPAGFSSGGSDGVGGQGDGKTWIDEVYWDPAEGDRLPPSGTSVEIESTAVASGVGIRLTVSSVWLPARPLASFVQDVTSIDVHSTHDQYGRQERTTHRSFTVSSPAAVLRAAVAFNDLPGMTPIAMPCPMMADQYTDRIVFHTVTGDVTAVSRSNACGFGMIVRRDGHRVDPQLGEADHLLAALGLRH